MKKLLFALPVLIAGLFFFSCVSSEQESTPVEEKTDTEETTEEIQEPEPTISYEYKIITESDNTYYLDSEIHYPQFPNNDSLNKAVENSLLETYRRVLQTAKTDWEEENEARRMSLAEQPDSESSDYIMPAFEYFGSLEQIAETDSLLSLTFDEYTYLGGAHGSPCIVTLNYSKEENRPVSISEVTGMTLDEISYLCYDVLLERLSSDGFTDLQWLQTGTEPVPENFSTFALTEDGKYFIVYFNPYQVAPYAYGTLSVMIEL